MKFEELNTSNLWSLYRAIGSGAPGCRLLPFPNYSIVLSGGTAWPNCVFDIDAKSGSEGALIDDMHRSISEGGASALIISPDNTAFDLSLRKSPYHYYPVDQWTGMYRNIEPDETFVPAGSDCDPVIIDPSGIAEWAGVVSEELFNGKPLATGIFGYLLATGHKLIALKRQGIIIGTALIFHDQFGTAGIYMVCIRAPFRAKGFGKVILAWCLENIRLSESRVCVLQSTRLALPLYAGSGFSQSNLYRLFWKIK